MQDAPPIKFPINLGPPGSDGLPIQIPEPDDPDFRDAGTPVNPQALLPRQTIACVRLSRGTEGDAFMGSLRMVNASACGGAVEERAIPARKKKAARQRAGQQ